jgi:hypothetical protein
VQEKSLLAGAQLRAGYVFTEWCLVKCKVILHGAVLSKLQDALSWHDA